MLKTLVRIGFAAIVAGGFVFLTSGTPKAYVAADVQAAPAASAKGNHLVLAVKGAACSRQGWPDFERHCQFDLRRPGNKAPAVRIIALR